MEAADFLGVLKSRDITFLAGVPDSTFGPLFDVADADPQIEYIPAVREDSALGIVSAAYFADRRGAVLMQNSGVGNVINPLTSFNLMYKIPALLIVGWRGYGGPPNDAPEHWVMGEKTPKFFDLLDMPYAEFEPEHGDSILAGLLAAIDERSIPGALLVRAGQVT